MDSSRPPRVLLVLLAALVLGGCHLAPSAPVEASPYVCPNGLRVRAGLTEDHRQLRLTVDGRTHTLVRSPRGESYSNGYYTARLDDLFLHLGIPGTLLPQHCRLQIAPPP